LPRKTEIENKLKVVEENEKQLIELIAITFWYIFEEQFYGGECT
jgi:hypothetical protein